MSNLKTAFAVLGIFTVLCASAAPLSSYADANNSVSGNTDLTVNVRGSINMEIANTSVTTLEINTNDINTSTMHTTLNVSANGYSSYNVTVADADENTSLVHTTANSNSIPASATLASGTSAWAIKVGDSGSWTAMVASTAANPISVISGGTGTTSATVHYGVSTSATQLSGEYRDTIVYTAIAN